MEDKDILDTTGVQSSTIHRSSHHIVQRSRMIIVVALLSKLLFEEIRVERTRFSRDTRGYMNVFSRHGSQRRPLEKRSAIVWFSTVATGEVGARGRVAGSPKRPEDPKQ